MLNIKEDLSNLRLKIEKAREELYIIRMTNKEQAPKTLRFDKKKQKKIIRDAKIEITSKLKENKDNREK